MLRLNKKREEGTPIFTMRDAAKLRRLLVPPSPKIAQANADVPLPQSTKMLHSILPQNSWAGRRCWIVAGGPSLKGVNLDFLKGELVIGVNRAYEICDPTILLCMDQRLWGWIVKGELGEESREKFEAYQGIKCWAVFSTLGSNIPPDEGYFLMSNKTHGVGGTLSTGMNWGCNGGFAAVNLAILLGANPIYLLGYDMNPVKDKKGKKQWWHDGYPADGQKPTVYDLFINEFEGHKKAFLDTKKEIVNLNPSSGLKVFKMGDLDSVTATQVRRPLVVCFHTHPEYEKLARRMEQSARRFGMEVEISKVESKGGWLKNVQHKAKFILDKLVEKKRDIVWLDADSIVNTYPVLFDNFDGDIGVHICDWKRHTGGRRDQRELLGAVIYCRYNTQTVALLKAWVKAVAAEPMRYEQLTLFYTLSDTPEGKKVKVVELPAEYCTIFDTMRDVEHPVIEQFQASRQLRGLV